MKPKALVLLSGGIDSAVSLWLAKQKGWDITVLSFDGHLRPRGEEKAFQRLCHAAGVQKKITLPLPFIKEARKNAKAPEGYIPSRNLVYYSIAASLAEELGATVIVGGHNRSDGASFPDARSDYFQTLNQLIRKGSQAKAPRLYFPVISLTHDEVIALGERLGVPLQYTWTCYRDGSRPCGRCQSCRERAKAFHRAGLTDPALSSKEH